MRRRSPLASPRLSRCSQSLRHPLVSRFPSSSYWDGNGTVAEARFDLRVDRWMVEQPEVADPRSSDWQRHILDPLGQLAVRARVQILEAGAASVEQL